MIVGELIVEACPGSGVQKISPADDIGRQRRGQIYRRERSPLMPDTPFVYSFGSSDALVKRAGVGNIVRIAQHSLGLFPALLG